MLPLLQRWAEMMNDPRIATQSVNFLYINWPEEQWIGGACEPQCRRGALAPCLMLAATAARLGEP